MRKRDEVLFKQIVKQGSNGQQYIFFLKNARNALLNEPKIYKKEPTRLVVKGLL